MVMNLATWLDDLAAKKPTPGGGAAAGIAAAIAVALGAMAARYTTGKRHLENEAEALALAGKLDDSRNKLLALADEDERAYAHLQAVNKNATSTAAEKAQAADAAAAVPADMVRLCAHMGGDLARFGPRCNKWLISDLNAAIHLLIGAAGAAWETLLINDPAEPLKSEIAAHLADLRKLAP